MPKRIRSVTLSSGRRARRWLIVLVVLTITAGACQSATPPPQPPVSSGLATPAPASTEAPKVAGVAPADPSAWDQVMRQIGPNGVVSANTALQAFSLAFGPLPGVTVPSGPAGSIRSGSAALRWLVAHWYEITDAQRAEAVRLVPELGGLGGLLAEGPRPALAAEPPVFHLSATQRRSTDYAALAQTMADEIEGKTGLPLLLILFAAEGRTQQTHVQADTLVYNAQGGYTGTAAKCVITISPRGAADLVVDLEAAIGHEVWHCYQAQIRGLAWYYSYVTPGWLIEGQAEWIGAALRPTAKARGWQSYLLEPERRLFTRSYDAIGFYADLMQAQIDTWDVLIPMLQAIDTNVARFEAARASSDQFLDTWASGYFRDTTLGPAWEFEGPGLPVGQAPVHLVLTIANGQAEPFSVPAYANSIFDVTSTADILVFVAEGHARLGDARNRQDYVLTEHAFCTKTGSCTCPPGTAFSAAPPTRLSTDTNLALTGGPSGTIGTVRGYALTEFCAQAGDS